MASCETRTDLRSRILSPIRIAAFDGSNKLHGGSTYLFLPRNGSRLTLLMAVQPVTGDLFKQLPNALLTVLRSLFQLGFEARRELPGRCR